MRQIKALTFVVVLLFCLSLGASSLAVKVLVGGWWDASLEELTNARDAVNTILEGKDCPDYKNGKTNILRQGWQDASTEELSSAVLQLNGQIANQGKETSNKKTETTEASTTIKERIKTIIRNLKESDDKYDCLRESFIQFQFLGIPTKEVPRSIKTKNLLLVLEGSNTVHLVSYGHDFKGNLIVFAETTWIDTSAHMCTYLFIIPNFCQRWIEIEEALKDVTFGIIVFNNDGSISSLINNRADALTFLKTHESLNR